jgi:hypothetical protein
MLVYDVSCVYLVQVSLILIGPQGLGHFLRYLPFLPIGWRTEQIVRQNAGGKWQYNANHLSAIQAASQSFYQCNIILHFC